MSRKAVAASLALVLAGALPLAGHAQPRRGPGNYANPSALIAAEIAFHRLAEEKGQWTAFRQTADEAAVMFVPQPVMAQGWLKGRDNPPRTVDWQPYEVWMSCDGSLGVTRGAWQRADGSVGYFTTVWKRQEKGDYRWVLDQGDALSKPLEAPDMLSASVAQCPDRGDGREGGPRDGKGRQKPAEQPVPKVAAAAGGAASLDGTLRYAYKVEPDNARTITVTMRQGGKDETVLQSSVAAPIAE